MHAIRCPSCGGFACFDPPALRPLRCPGCDSPVEPRALPQLLHDEQELVRAQEDAPVPVILAVTSETCPACTLAGPVLRAVSVRAGGSVLVLTLDADRSAPAADLLNAEWVPMVLLFRGGKEAGRVPGVPPLRVLEAWSHSGARGAAAPECHSAEQEHREILELALRGPQRRSLAAVLASMPDAGTDADFARTQKDRRR